MYAFELKTADKVVYRRENSSVQAKVGHDELANIPSRLAGPEPDYQTGSSSDKYGYFYIHREE
jgi:hypothetical protein